MTMRNDSFRLGDCDCFCLEYGSGSTGPRGSPFVSCWRVSQILLLFRRVALREASDSHSITQNK